MPRSLPKAASVSGVSSCGVTEYDTSMASRPSIAFWTFDNCVTMAGQMPAQRV